MYLIVNKIALTTHLSYKDINDRYLFNFYDDEFYEHVEIPKEFEKYIEYIQAKRESSKIVLTLDNETKQRVDQEKWRELRIKRNLLLRECDFYFLSDYPIDFTSKQEVMIYRQQLRDIPQIYDSPFDVKWPILDFIKK